MIDLKPPVPDACMLQRVKLACREVAFNELIHQGAVQASGSLRKYDPALKLPVRTEARAFFEMHAIADAVAMEALSFATFKPAVTPSAAPSGGAKAKRSYQIAAEILAIGIIVGLLLSNFVR
jgi:hypothetical protein